MPDKGQKKTSDKKADKDCKADNGNNAGRKKANKPQVAEGARDRLAKFSLDDPNLPDAIADNALGSGDYPYEDGLKTRDYEDQIQPLQLELLKLQSHTLATGERVVIVFEGRDAAGKGGTIKRFMEHLNPRHARAIALSKPTEAERGQWYFQRYVPHMPTAGSIVLFDRSWYNRAGVERVMDFCTKDQLADFLREAPQFEGMLVRDNIRLFKIFLNIGQEMQLSRLHARRHDPFKRWKLTDMDLKAVDRWDAYTEAFEDLFRFTHTTVAPWTVVRANDKKRARLEAMRHVLSNMEYEGKDTSVARAPDPRIVGSGPEFFDNPGSREGN